MLRVDKVYKRFGGLAVMNGLDLMVPDGEVRCILGPNGTGKTTLFNLISGRDRPDAGTIEIGGRKVGRARVFEVARWGVSRKFQSPSVFDDLTVEDNLLIGATGRAGLSDLLLSRRRAGTAVRMAQVLDDLALATLRCERAGDLSHGQRQWLEIGMVLLNDPDLILLDEPTAGMTLAETARTADLIRETLKGRTTLVIEHDIAFVRRLGARVTVLYGGTVLCEGSFDEIAADERVRRVYLGENP